MSQSDKSLGIPLAIRFSAVEFSASELLATAWGISKSEAVRRAVREAAEREAAVLSKRSPSQ